MTPQNAPPNLHSRDPSTPAHGAAAAREHHRSLRSKLVLGVAAVLCALFVLDEMVRKRIIRQEVAVLEQQQAVRDVNRVSSAIRRELGHLGELADQAADRPELLAIADTGADPDGPEMGSLFGLGTADWAFLADGSGSIHWVRPSRGQLAGREDGEDLPLQQLAAHARQSPGDRATGIHEDSDGGFALFAAAPLRAGDATPSEPARKPAIGSDTVDRSRNLLVVGRTLDEQFLDRLRRQTHVPFAVEPATGKPQNGMDEPSRLVIRNDPQETAHVAMPLVAFDSTELAHLLVKVPHEISAHALHANRRFRNYFLFGSVAALLALLWLLQRIVVAPVVAIREHTERIAEQGLETEPLVIAVNDEIGELANAFDRMTERLSDAQRSLSETSRAAGARQVAETVIHNIGNVLTNVNSLMDSANAQVAGLRVQPLNRLADRLGTTADDRELLEATPMYLRSLADSLARDQQRLGELLGTLGGNLRHIHDVIRDQGRYARPRVDAEPFVVGELIRESIDCCRASLERDQISVRRTGALRDTIRTDRSMLLQVFINVVGNAKDSLQLKPDGDRELHIEIEPGDETLQITFQDNGIGMDPSTLQHAFDAHFTTRSAGTGLGLHFCALAISRLGGDMRALSDGPGQGASFVIELPRVPPADSSTAFKLTHLSTRRTLEAGA